MAEIQTVRQIQKDLVSISRRLDDIIFLSYKGLEIPSFLRGAEDLLADQVSILASIEFSMRTLDLKTLAKDE